MHPCRAAVVSLTNIILCSAFGAMVLHNHNGAAVLLYNGVLRQRFMVSAMMIALNAACSLMPGWASLAYASQGLGTHGCLPLAFRRQSLRSFFHYVRLASAVRHTSKLKTQLLVILPTYFSAAAGYYPSARDLNHRAAVAARSSAPSLPYFGVIMTGHASWTSEFAARER